MGKRGIRYSDEERVELARRAKELAAGGMAQRDIAAELGVAIATLSKMLKDGKKAPKGRPGRKPAAEKAPKVTRARKTPKEPSAAAPSNPLMRMTTLRDQLDAVRAEIAQMSSQLAKAQADEESLAEELKTLYNDLGSELFGAGA